MKKIVSTLLTGGLLLAYLLLITKPLPTSSGNLPPLGTFLNPFSGFWSNAEKTKPNLTEIRIDDTRDIEILIDERGVPHIFCKSENDRLFAQGFVHARDRLWQMDISSRQAGGRLSEILGERLLDNDKRMRLLGMNEAAKRYSETWKTCPDIELLENYVEGVNAYIDQLRAKDYPIEFKLLNYQPEAWTLHKIALVFMNMNLVLCSRSDDIKATNALSVLGLDTFNYLFPRWNPNQSPIIPPEKEWEFTFDKEKEPGQSLGYFGHKTIYDSPEFVGSNNWAVSGAKTEEGYPILCNDPHLSLSLPSIWYELHMVSDDANVYGVSIAGLPNIAIGFNEDIAWGETNVGMDVLDYYEIKWKDNNKRSYIIDGKERPVEYRVESYQVKDIGSISDTILITQWGAVRQDGARDLAVQWLPNLTADNCVVKTFYDLNLAKNFDDYYESLKSFSSPAQNFAFASKDGDIALKVQGKLPIKPRGEGQFVFDGSTDDNQWKAYIPFDHTPFIKNPERGFISSANQHSTDTSYPYQYHGYFADYRGRTINRILERSNDITTDFMKELQFNAFDQSAAELCPVLVSLVQLDDESPSVASLKALENWNFHYDPDSEQAVIWEIWKTRFINEILENLSTEDHEMLAPELWRIVELTQTDPSLFIFDDPNTEKQESAADLAISTWHETSHLVDSLKKVNDKLSWQQYRPMSINHLTQIPAFSARNIHTGGTGTAINATKTSFGPSWRMVVQLSEPIKAWGIYPGGQSGNPGSPHYKNMIDTWAKGEYYPLHFVGAASELSQEKITTRIMMQR